MIQWSRTGESKIFDEYFSIAEAPGGGYVVAGSTQTYWEKLPLKSPKRWERTVRHWERDALLVGVDANGNEVWRSQIGKKTDDCYVSSIVPSPDGGFVCAGTYSMGFTDDIWLFGVDEQGSYLWGKQFGISGREDWATSVEISQDGGFLITGGSESYGMGSADAILLKTDNAGEREWKYTTGGDADDWFTAVVECVEGGYLAVGLTRSEGAGSSDILAARIDADGNEVWRKTFGAGGFDWAEDVVSAPEGGYVVAGGTDSSGNGWADAWVVKIDAEGKRQWEKTIGGEGPDWVTSITTAPDGSYLMTGVTASTGEGMADAWLFALSGGGEVIWEKTFGDKNGDWSNCILTTSDEGCVLAGESLSEGKWAGAPYRSYNYEIKDKNWQLGYRTGSNKELYGNPLLVKMKIPPKQETSYTGGWDENVNDGTIWTHRIPVLLEERLGITRIDEPVTLKVSEIFGHTFDLEAINPDSIRVVDPDLPPESANEVGGNDVTSIVEDAEGDRKLSSIDKLTFLSNVPAMSSKTYYVYYSESPVIGKAEYPEISGNLAMNPGFEKVKGGTADLWAPYESGYEAVSDEAHRGDYCIRIEASDESAVATAYQSHSFDPADYWESITISGWAKAEEVSGVSDYLFSLETHLKYDEADAATEVDFIEFDTGTHDWQYMEMTLYPSNPVREVASILVFRNHVGRVWFDDLEIHPLAYQVTVEPVEDNTEEPPDIPVTDNPPTSEQPAGDSAVKKEPDGVVMEKISLTQGLGAVIFILLLGILVSFVLLKKRT